MKVRDLMMGNPAFCVPGMNLGSAVELFWNRNCGILPVVVDNRVKGVITDRDVCIALGTRNCLPSEITVKDVMRETVHSCGADETIRQALQTMAEAKVRRLPVVDANGALEGILSMDDVIIHLESRSVAGKGEIAPEDVVTTLKSIYGQKLPVPILGRTAVA